MMVNIVLVTMVGMFTKMIKTEDCIREAVENTLVEVENIQEVEELMMEVLESIAEEVD